MTQHEWLTEVIGDIERYALKNSLFGIAQAARATKVAAELEIAEGVPETSDVTVGDHDFELLNI